jgi:hypothetical protein
VICWGVDAGSRSLREADHLAHDLVRRLGLPAGSLACTHLVRTGTPHVAVSFATPDPVSLAELAGFGIATADRIRGPAEWARGAAQARALLADRAGGRAVWFPGSAELTGEVTVADLLARTAIDRVDVLAGGPAAATDLVRTRDHVRPEWRDGALVLVTTPVAAGVLAPFEVPNPTPCCADHA